MNYLSKMVTSVTIEQQKLTIVYSLAKETVIILLKIVYNFTHKH